MNKGDNITEPVLQVTSIDDLLAGRGLTVLQQRLITYLPRQRWFGAKSKTIKAILVLDSAVLPGLNAALLYLQVNYEDESTDVYQIPLAVTADDATEKTDADPNQHHCNGQYPRRVRYHPRCGGARRCPPGNSRVWSNATDSLKLGAASCMVTEAVPLLRRVAPIHYRHVPDRLSNPTLLFFTAASSS